MATFVVASATGRYFVFNPARATLNRGDQMLCSGGVEAVIELQRTPDAQVTIALEDCLHALPAIHLTGFLVIHCSSQGRGTEAMWGLGL